MKSNHIATIGVACLFGVVGASAISLMEYRLLNEGRDAITAFFLPSQEDAAAREVSPPSLVATNFQPITHDSDQLVADLKAEMAEKSTCKTVRKVRTRLNRRQLASLPKAERMHVVIAPPATPDTRMLLASRAASVAPKAPEIQIMVHGEVMREFAKAQQEVAADLDRASVTVTQQ